MEKDKVSKIFEVETINGVEETELIYDKQKSKNAAMNDSEIQQSFANWLDSVLEQGIPEKAP